MMMNWIKRIKMVVRPAPEKGMALVIALMLLAIMSLLGASALLTTNVEIKISGNTRVGRTAFYSADGAGQATGGIIADCIGEVGWSNNYAYGAGVIVNDGQFAFESQARTGVPDDSGDLDNSNDLTNAPDITFSAPMAAVVDVDKGPTVPVAGSSAVAATGYEGTGKGAAGGGLKTVYHIHVRGLVGNRAMSSLFMTYDHYL